MLHEETVVGRILRRFEGETNLLPPLNETGRKNPNRALSSLSSYGKFLIPTGTVNDGFQDFETAKLLKIYDMKHCHRHLLWHILFKGCTSLEWFILFQNLENKKMVASEESRVCLFGVLSLSASTRERLPHWTSRTKPLFRLLKTRKATEDSRFSGMSLLEVVVSSLKIPQKGAPVDELYVIQNFTPRRPTVKELCRIGVGYKDKGTLSPETEYIPTLLEIPPEFEDFVGSFSLSEKWKDFLQQFV